MQLRQKRFKRYLIAVPCVLAVVFLCAALDAAAETEMTVRSAHVEAALIPEMQAVRPGSSFWAAVRLRMDEGWHTYWKNPGDSGLATSLDWQLPAGFKAGPILWPAPDIFESNEVVSYGYEGEVSLLVRIDIPKEAHPGREEIFRGHVRWLSCREVCVAGEADLSFIISVEQKSRVEPEWTGLFTKARSKLPQRDLKWGLSVDGFPETYRIRLSAPELMQERIESATFFADDSNIIDHAAPQVWNLEDNGYRLLVRRSSVSQDAQPILKGVVTILYKDGLRRSLDFEAPIVFLNDEASS